MMRFMIVFLLSSLLALPSSGVESSPARPNAIQRLMATYLGQLVSTQYEFQRIPQRHRIALVPPYPHDIDPRYYASLLPKQRSFRPVCTASIDIMRRWMSEQIKFAYETTRDSGYGITPAQREKVKAMWLANKTAIRYEQHKLRCVQQFTYPLLSGKVTCYPRQESDGTWTFDYCEHALDMPTHVYRQARELTLGLQGEHSDAASWPTVEALRASPSRSSDRQ